MEPTRDPVPPKSAQSAPSSGAESVAKKGGMSGPHDESGRKSALRVQAAAVAAQQAGLTEEESRLNQRKLSLEQQEAQLAAHLEEKRHRLIELQKQVRQARATLLEERKAFEIHSQEITRQQSQDRAEVAASQQQAQTERRRLLTLRQRLKWRFHRHWAAERKDLARQQDALAHQRRELDREKEQLRQKEAALVQERLRYNGEVELGRRDLEAAREQLRLEQAKVREQGWKLAGTEAELARVQAEQVRQQRNLEKNRRRLQREAEGLENRISQLRGKLAELESQSTMGQGMSPPPDLPVSNRVDTAPREAPVGEGELALSQRLAELDEFANDLADQRLHLAEQYERFARTQQQWQQDHESALAELEPLAQRLQEREQTVEAGESELRHCQDELAQWRKNLEAWQGRLTVQSANGESERDRWTLETRAKAELAERRLALAVRLRQRLHQRYGRQVERLRTELSAWAELRQEAMSQREEWLRRLTLLEEQQRAVSERALALEQFRLEITAQGGNPKAAEKRLERLRRRLASVSAGTLRSLSRERQALKAESERLQERFAQLKWHAEFVVSQEAPALAQKLTAEQDQALADGERVQWRQELLAWRGKRDIYERQLRELQDEVERLGRLLLDEAGPPSLPLGQAA